MRALRASVFTTISALLMMVPTLAHGQTLTAMWDPNPPSDAVTSYEICIGTTSLSCNFQLATVAAGQTLYTFAPSPGVLYRVAVRSVNAAGPGPYSDEVAISIPGLTQPANQSSQMNVAISPLSLSASDPDGGTIQFTHSGLPFGLSLNQSTGIITGTPTSPGTSNVTIFVSDDSVTTSRSFVWTVTTGSTSPTSPANASTLSADRTSPQPVGTTVTFSAGASGGTGPYSYKWWVKRDGGEWTLLQDWSTSTTLAWTPNASGTYAIGIWARSNGVTADGPQTSAIAEFGVSATSTPPPSTPPPTSPANASTLSADRTSPQPVGTTVTFSAGASGGASPYSYKWWVRQNGGAWTLLQDWSPSTTLAWTPNASGTYAIGIWARSNGVTADGPQTSAIADFGVSATSTPPLSPPPSTPPPSLPPPTYASLAANRTSPQPGGTTVTFSAGASGGASPYSYKWWVKLNGGAWTVLQDWSTSTTLAWTPNASGTYAIGIWARSNGVTADSPQTSAIAEFVVSGTSTAPSSPAPSTPPPSLPAPTYASLAANLTSPQPVGTTVTFSAGASGGASPYSYKWWVRQNGGAWTLLQDWSPSTTLAWTPNASGTYAIGIWARSNGVTADGPQTSAIADFGVSATSTPPLSPPPSTPPPSLPPPTYASLAANRTSPQPGGTTVTFSAGASGGASPYSYKWWVKLNGGAWTVLQDWSTSTTLAWTPNASGTYAIGIWARSNGVTADSPQTSAIAEFVVSGTSTAPSSPAPSTPPPSLPPPSSQMYAALAANRTSPQPGGTTVTFSAGASGGASPYSYKWWVKLNGGAWTVLQDWSTSTTLAWTPNASGTYAIGIWARSNGVTADSPQTSAIAEFDVSASLPLSPPPSPFVNPPTSALIGVDRPDTQPTGTALTFSASASGGASPYSYKWWVKLKGGEWTVLRDWNASATLTLTPTMSGTYVIGIWARSNGVTADMPQTSAILEFSVKSP